jgi:exopolysaccharide production protein ExoZ
MIQNIQALRFFAALAVVLFHVSSIYVHHQGELLRPFAIVFDPYGRVGVDVFFVISGYVIWTSTTARHSRSDIAPFALRRFARIFVTYWPMLAFAALVDTFIRQRDFSDVNIWHSISLLPAEFSGSDELLLLLPVSWTLTFEVLFYTVFAAMMMLPRLLAFLAMMLWGAVALTPLAPEGTFLSPYISEFAAGCTLAVFIRNIRPEKISLPLVGFAMALLFLVGAQDESDWWRVIWFGSFSVLLVLLAICLESRGLVAHRFLVEMGGASYALYLGHFPILQAFSHQWQIVKVHPELMLLPVIVLSLMLSLAWWLLFEKRANRRIVSLVNARFHRAHVTPEASLVSDQARPRTA